MHTSLRHQAGFTVRELLAALICVTILLSIVLPSLASSRKGAGVATSMSNLMQINFGQFMYAMDYNGRQVAVARDELGYYGSDEVEALVVYESTVGPHPPVFLGWDESGLWNFPLWPRSARQSRAQGRRVLSRAGT